MNRGRIPKTTHQRYLYSCPKYRCKSALLATIGSPLQRSLGIREESEEAIVHDAVLQFVRYLLPRGTSAENINGDNTILQNATRLSD